MSKPLATPPKVREVWKDDNQVEWTIYEVADSFVAGISKSGLERRWTLEGIYENDLRRILHQLEEKYKEKVPTRRTRDYIHGIKLQVLAKYGMQHSHYYGRKDLRVRVK